MPVIDSNLLVAVIAAGSALLGSAVGQLGPVIQHWLSSRKERQAFLRGRYEEMANLAASITVELSRKLGPDRRGRPPTENNEGIMQSSLSMQTLARLYFPELLDATAELHKAAWAMLVALVRDQDAEVQSASRNVGLARKSVDERLQKYASKYT